MPVEAQSPQVNTVGNSSPPSAESYVAAAMEALKSAPVDPAEPVLGEKKETPKVEAKTEEKTEEKKEEPKGDEKKEDDEDAPSDSLKRSFEKLAKGNAELRAKEERLKPLLAMVDRMDPNSLSAVARAVQANDPVSALAALGFSHHDYARTVANGRAPAREEQEEQDTGELSPSEQRIARLEQQLAEMNIEKGRSKAMKAISELAADPAKFKFVTRAGAEAHEKALAKLEDYFAKTGKMPAEDRQESYLLALESVEADFKKEATKWQRLLTDEKSTNIVAPDTGATELQPRAASSEKAKSTLTNSTATAPQTAPNTGEPKTPEEFQRRTAALLAQLDR